MKIDKRILETKTKDLSSEKTRNEQIHTITVQETLEKAIQKILNPENKNRAVAVTDSQGQVISLITEKDVLTYVYNNKNVKTQETSVDKVANTEFFFVLEDDNVQTAIQKMNENKVSHALIKDKNGKYFGWIDRNDIVKKLKEIL